MIVYIFWGNISHFYLAKIDNVYYRIDVDYSYRLYDITAHNINTRYLYKTELL